tara:strand:+ start:641 stop:1855 length:1215 start_codon:yes stop_codon:yes gene_type:complete
MKRNFFFISLGLPSSHTGGSALFSINLLRELKKDYNIIALNPLKDYFSKNLILKAKKELKKEKIKYHIIKANKKIFDSKHITLWNFYKINYYNKEKVREIEKFVNKIGVKEKDIIYCAGSNCIAACKNIKATKIAMTEDIQDQVQIYRTYLSMNKFNFIKKIIKILMLKVFFRNHHNWLKEITSKYDIIYTYSPFDYSKLKNKINLSVLSAPMNFKIKKKNKKNKIFNISMYSSTISQDFNGVILFYKKLLPKLKEENLLHKVRLNIVMRIPKNIPAKITEIIEDKNIHVQKYNKKTLDETDMLFYPSKYPVGVRSKILHAFSRSWFVATSDTIKKCIPELEDFKNCIMSDNINKLVDKILYIINNQKDCEYIMHNSQKVLKNYSPKISAKKVIKDIKNAKSKS